MHDYEELFGMEGPLATAIPGFATREEQIAMAEQVALALRSHGRLIVEAGTGTGKTFAYLVPALTNAVMRSAQHDRGEPGRVRDGQRVAAGAGGLQRPICGRPGHPVVVQFDQQLGGHAVRLGQPR